MTDEELKRIERHLALAVDCKNSLASDAEALVAEVRRLRGLVRRAVDEDCPWCDGDETDGRDFPERRHAAGCPAFTPSGDVR